MTPRRKSQALRKSRPIVVLGSSNTDMVTRLPRLPRPGETLLGGEFFIAAGGKGANQAVAAARAGGKVSFVGCVGQDDFGNRALRALRKDGIDVDLVKRDPYTHSGVALIFVAHDGENSIAVAPGANARLRPADLRPAAARIRAASWLVLQLESPLETVQAALRMAARFGVRTLLNPAPARPLPTALLRQVNILTPNQHEAELLTGVRVKNVASASRAAAKLRNRGVQTVIITLGERGALVCAPLCEELVPGFKVKAVDSTAAGDVFNGALAVALGEGMGLKAAVRFANAAAAISVTRMGAQPSAPTRAEIDQFLRISDLAPRTKLV